MDGDEQRLRPVTISLTVLAIILALWAGYYWMVLTWTEIPLWTGPFGDAFGALNTLFSGLAFGGVIVTILLQTHELKLQRKELRDTREVMKEQSRNFEKQLLDDSFYQQIRLYNGNVTALRSELTINGPKQGRDAVKDIIEFYWETVGKAWVRQEETNSKLDPEKVPAGWQMNIIGNHFHREIWPRLSHVIQTFVAIAELISSAEHETQKRYARIFWAQFSVAEQQLFRLYIITPHIPGTTIRMLDDLEMIYKGEWGVRDDIKKVLRAVYKDVMGRVYAHLKSESKPQTP